MASPSHPVGWTAEEEQAWSKLPRVYRWQPGTQTEVPLTDLVTRRAHLASWASSDSVWRTGLLLQDRESVDVWIAWAKSNPQAARASGFRPGQMGDPETTLISLTRWWIEHDIDLHVRLCQEAHWPSFVGIRRYHPDDKGLMEEIWQHPRLETLWAQVKDDDLMGLFDDMSLSLWALPFSPTGDGEISQQEQRTIITPLMNLIEQRMKRGVSMDIQMAWENLLNQVNAQLNDVKADLGWRSPSALSPRDFPTLPSRFSHVHNNDCQVFVQWALAKVFAEQPQAWREALILLSSPDPWNVDHERAWRAWLQNQGPAAASLSGVVANRPEGVSLPSLVADSPNHHRVWLELGLPSAKVTWAAIKAPPAAAVPRPR